MGILREHLGLKLISLVLAVLLEVYFYSPDNSVGATLFVPIELSGLASGTMVVEPLNLGKGLAAEVQVRGPKSLVDQLRTNTQKFSVRVASEQAEFSVVLEPSQLSLPKGVDVDRIKPERILVRTEREVVKELIVVVDRHGQVPSGYKLERLAVFPQSVTVRGPLSQLEKLQAVETSRLDISGISTPMQKELGLKNLGSLVQTNVTAVTVDLQIEPIPLQKTLHDVDIEVVAPSGVAASVHPSRVKVTVEGPTETVKSLGKDEIKLVADARGLSSGKHEVEPLGSLPRDVRILKIEPARVSVSVESSG